MASRQDEFAALLERYSRAVASAIRRVCSRRYGFLVADIEQDVYMAIWKRLGSGKEIEHPASYLYKVALTTALAEVRKHTPDTTPIERHEGGPLATSLPVGDLLPAERTRLLAEVLESLPLEESRAVRAHLAGFNHTEVAALFGWTQSVARHRIYRGIASLKERMGEGQNERDARD